MKHKLLIAGGGLAGAAAAAELAHAGIDVTLVERELLKPETTARHKICGEFLSSEAQLSLARIGFDVSQLGGHEITELLIARGHAAFTCRLPFKGLGISRSVLDEALLAHAGHCGAHIRRGLVISSVGTGQAPWLEIDGSPPIAAETLFLATGKHELRGLRRVAAAPADDLVGFKMYFQLAAAPLGELAHKIALILFNDGYAGLQLVENGQANFCLLTSRQRLRRLQGQWPKLLDSFCQESTFLARMLAGARQILAQPLSIYRVPYGYIHRPASSDPASIFRLGDQAGVIHSFTGDGMAIALHSAGLASRFYLAGENNSGAYHRRLAADIEAQIRRAGWLYRAAQGPLQPFLFNLMRAFPALPRLAATATRIPPRVRLDGISNTRDPRAN